MKIYMIRKIGTDRYWSEGSWKSQYWGDLSLLLESTKDTVAKLGEGVEVVTFDLVEEKP